MKMNNGKMAVVLKILQQEYEKVINGFNVKGFIQDGNTAIVELKGINYNMWDNGGEIGIEEINARYYNNDKLAKMIPLTSWGLDIDVLTLAYRCIKSFNGEPIDYDFKEKKDIAESYLEFMGIDNVEIFIFN